MQPQDLNGKPIPVLRPEKGSDFEQVTAAATPGALLDISGYRVLGIYATADIKIKLSSGAGTNATNTSYDMFLAAGVRYDISTDGLPKLSVFGMAAGIFYGCGML